MHYIVLFVFIAVFNVIVSYIYHKITTKTLGTIYVDFTDPNKDVYQIKIDDLSVLNHKKKVLLLVDFKNFDTHD